MNDTIFVTGAAGQLGQLVIKHLLAPGVAPSRIVAGTRSPDKLAGLATAGIAMRSRRLSPRTSSVSPIRPCRIPTVRF